MVCETEDFKDSYWEDDLPDVKVDMAAKTVFAVGGASGRQILWTQQVSNLMDQFMLYNILFEKKMEIISVLAQIVRQAYVKYLNCHIYVNYHYSLSVCISF